MPPSQMSTPQAALALVAARAARKALTNFILIKRVWLSVKKMWGSIDLEVLLGWNNNVLKGEKAAS